MIREFCIILPPYLFIRSQPGYGTTRPYGLRGAEKYLNEAEAQCQLGNFIAARQLMQQLGDIRYPDGSYSSRLAEMTESKELSLKSSESMIVQTLMDKIILQRRIELWDEPDPESWEWILMICQ